MTLIPLIFHFVCRRRPAARPFPSLPLLPCQQKPQKAAKCQQITRCMYIFSCLLVVHTHTKAVFNPQAAVHPMGVIAAFNIAKRMPNRLSGLPSRGFGDSGKASRWRPHLSCSHFPLMSARCLLKSLHSLQAL